MKKILVVAVLIFVSAFAFAESFGVKLSAGLSTAPGNIGTDYYFYQKTMDLGLGFDFGLQPHINFFTDIDYAIVTGTVPNNAEIVQILEDMNSIENLHNFKCNAGFTFAALDNGKMRAKAGIGAIGRLLYRKDTDTKFFTVGPIVKGIIELTPDKHVSLGIETAANIDFYHVLLQGKEQIAMNPEAEKDMFTNISVKAYFKYGF